MVFRTNLVKLDEQTALLRKDIFNGWLCDENGVCEIMRQIGRFVIFSTCFAEIV